MGKKKSLSREEPWKGQKGIQFNLKGKWRKSQDGGKQITYYPASFYNQPIGTRSVPVRSADKLSERSDHGYTARLTGEWSVCPTVTTAGIKSPGIHIADTNKKAKFRNKNKKSPCIRKESRAIIFDLCGHKV